jgi:hypothetical protein
MRWRRDIDAEVVMGLLPEEFCRCVKQIRNASLPVSFAGIVTQWDIAHHVSERWLVLSFLSNERGGSFSSLGGAMMHACASKIQAQNKKGGL